MREIKFRYVYKKTSPPYSPEKNFEVDYISIEDIEADRCNNEICDYYRYSKRTIGWVLIARNEYTGLKDKNGKEIYEGDIVSFPYDRKDRIVPVSWGTDGWWVKLPGWFKTLFWVAYKCEVIGNIYENPGGVESE